MKKRYLMLIAAVLVVFGCGLASSHNQVNAAAWGAKKVFTTPKSTRGIWYFKEDHKVTKLRITAHTINGRKLYHVLPDKKYYRLQDKIEKMSAKKMRKTYNWLDKHQFQAYSMKWHHIAGFNVNSWLAGAGDGTYYVPTTRKIRGHKVKVLRAGGGYDNMFMFYAYKSRKLVK